MGEKICNRRGDKESFDERKLYASIYYPARETGYSETDAEELAETVTDEVIAWMDDHEDDVITSKEIREQTIALLTPKDEDVAFMYETHLDLS